jgi:hypothetical protein
MELNRKTIVQIAVLLVVALFLLQPLGMGGVLPNFFGSSDEDEGQDQSTTAIFNATIRTYEPILVLPADTNQSIIAELNGREDVKSVVVDAQGVIVETETRDDVFPLASYLKGKGVSSVSQANVIMPQSIEVMIGTETREVFSRGGVLPIITEPVLDSGSDVTVSMIAVVRNDLLIDYASPVILLDEKSILVDALVQDINHKSYSYIIPWESRNSLTNLSQYGEVDYKKSDAIIFSKQLDIGQIMAKKQFPYIEYIDAGSAKVSSSFDNLTQLDTNFQDVGYTLPDSILAIKTNSTPDIPFNATVTYDYEMLLLESSTEYVFDDYTADVEFDEEQELNSTIELNVNIVATDKKVVSLGSISPS